MPDLSDRLDRIDVKLDKLSEAISQPARIEERVSHQNDNTNQEDSKLSDLEARIRTLELQGSSRGVVIGSIERFGWIVITSLIGIVAYFFRK